MRDDATRALFPSVVGSNPGVLIPNNRDYSLSLVNPFGRASKNSKAKLLRNFDFFTLQCLQKQAFDACKTKKPAFRLAF